MPYVHNAYNTCKNENIYLRHSPSVMCESVFGFENGLKAFWAGVGLAFRPQKAETRILIEENKVDSDLNLDSNFCLSTITLVNLLCCPLGYSLTSQMRIRIQI